MRGWGGRRLRWRRRMWRRPTARGARGSTSTCATHNARMQERMEWDHACTEMGGGTSTEGWVACAEEDARTEGGVACAEEDACAV